VARAAEAFHAAHERLYGYAYRTGEVIEFVNWKVTGLGLIDRPQLDLAAPAGSETPGPSGFRGGYMLFHRDDLPIGFSAEGPAIVEEYGSTTVVDNGWRLEVDAFGNLVLRR